MQGWGTSARQRLRFLPLYLAVTLADALARRAPARSPRSEGTWPPGVSVIVPERDAPGMLDEALLALAAATDGIDEPVQVIVVANGAPSGRYDELRRKHPTVEWIVSETPLGFAGAIERGLATARYGGTYLLNNDMLLAPDALRRLLPLRAPERFALASQIFQRSEDGRREETGFTDWFVDGAGLHLFHAPPPAAETAVPQLCASGGATLFRTSLLRRYLPASRAYDPFYWEDAEWSLRAWRDGFEVLHCPASQATHRHRATTARFYDAPTLTRIVERNRLLFDLRHGASERSAQELLAAACALPYATQRELTHWRHALGVLRWRVTRRRAPQPIAPPVLADAAGRSAIHSSYSFHLLGSQETARRTRVLFVAPFAVFPPRHGGARRTAALIGDLARDHAVALLGDEASLYDPRSFAAFDGLAHVRLVQRQDAPPPAVGTRASMPHDLAARMTAHCHPALRDALATMVHQWRPQVVVVEHAELAPLVRERVPGTAWILDMHDAYATADFTDTSAAQAFSRDVAAYDAVYVCSDEDRALVTHPRVRVLPNGADGPATLVPSQGAQLLFVGPFRYAPNHHGILRFLDECWPAIRHAVPEATLAILGGDEGRAAALLDPRLRQEGVQVHGHRDDVPVCLAACALAINPLGAIRGSAVKLVETLAAGRVCVSTREGARGFAGRAGDGLVLVDDVAAMADPIIELLSDAAQRHRREAAITHEDHGWHHAYAGQRACLAELVRSR